MVIKNILCWKHICVLLCHHDHKFTVVFVLNNQLAKFKPLDLDPKAFTLSSGFEFTACYPGVQRGLLEPDRRENDVILPD